MPRPSGTWLACLVGLDTALAYVRNPSPEALSVALGQPTAPVTVPGAVSASTTYLAIAGVTAAPAAVLDQYSAVVGVTFAELWERLLGQQRHVEETTLDLYPTVHQALTAQRQLVLLGRLHPEVFGGDTRWAAVRVGGDADGRGIGQELVHSRDRRGLEAAGEAAAGA